MPRGERTQNDGGEGCGADPDAQTPLCANRLAPAFSSGFFLLMALIVVIALAVLHFRFC